MHISIQEVAEKLEKSNKLFSHGTLSVELYKRDQVDNQKPHDRDEIYVIASGEGEFLNDGKVIQFKAGDFLFVKAGVEHRFLNFSNDFSAWVFFYGPIGGE